MSEMFENLERCIRHQLQGHDGDTVEMVGEQLLDMARGDDNTASILLNDDYFQGRRRLPRHRRTRNQPAYAI